MGFLGSIGSFIMTPLYYLISAVLIGFHRVFGAIFGETRAGPRGPCRSSA